MNWASKLITLHSHTPFRDGLLELAMTDLCTKFEISTLTHYTDMKGDQKCKIMGGLGG